jgi:hypothetical protein
MTPTRPIRLARLTWLARRLRRITPAEIPYRAFSVLMACAHRFGLFDASVVPAPGDTLCGLPWVTPPAAGASAAVLAQADALLAGQLEVFGCAVPFHDGSPHWNRDPRSGHAIPRTFGLFIDFRHLAAGVDIKFLWEVNRHLWWVPVAQAYAATGEARYLDAIGTWLDTWLRDCPYPLGANWSSPVEHGIRLINWSLVWHLIGGPDSRLFEGARGRDLRKRWLASIYQHMHFARANYSRHSSADNHLIGEAAGIYVGCLTWPLWTHCAAWSMQAGRLLENETIRQFATDGVNREQSFCYHKFALEFLLAALLCGRANGVYFPVAFGQRIEAAVEFLAACIDVGGNVPAYGDADDANVFCLGHGEGFSAYRAVAALGARLFDRPAFAAAATLRDEAPDWLLPAAPAGAAPAGAALRRDFSRGGYVILGRDLCTPREIRVLFDVGPLGYNRIAGHGHADALSLQVSISGRPFLVDSGTYCYNTTPDLRQYFRGTRAHNTLTIDGQHQSVYGGSFLWLRDVVTRVEWLRLDHLEDGVEAGHDGYSRLRDPVRHRRRVTLDKARGVMRVEDSLDCTVPHEVELRWHLAPECTLALQGAAFVISRNTHDLVLEIDCQDGIVRCTAADAAADAPDAWISRRFYQRESSRLIIARTRLGPGTRIATTMRFGA